MEAIQLRIPCIVKKDQKAQNRRTLFLGVIERMESGAHGVILFLFRGLLGEEISGGEDWYTMIGKAGGGGKMATDVDISN